MIPTSSYHRTIISVDNISDNFSFNNELSSSNILTIKYYDRDGNLLHTSDDSSATREMLDDRLDPLYKNKSRPTEIKIWNCFKSGINVKFSNKGGEIFHSYYRGEHNIDSVIEKFRDRVDYDWLVENKDNVKFEIDPSVNSNNNNNCLLM